MVGENAKAIIWSGLEKGSTYIVNFAIQIILARLLTPEDYGVVAMLGIFFAISQAFIDSGFATTLIQKQNCSEKDYCSVFIFNIIVAITIYLIFYVGSPYLEEFYQIKNLSLVSRVYALNLVINSLSMVHRVILMKTLQFKKIAIITLLSSVVSALPAVVLAYLGYGYWALVFQAIISNVLSTFLIWVASKWTPHFIFSKVSLLNLAPLGVRIMLVSQFHAVYNNIYSILIGKKFSAIDLGYFDRGKTLSSTGPVGFSDFFMRALFPIQSKIQNDMMQLKASYDKSFSLITKIIIPFSIFIAFFSFEFVTVLYGERWQECSILLSILSIGYAFYPLQHLNINILKVKGVGKYLLHSELLKKIIGIIVVLVLIRFDLVIVALGWTLCAILEFFISVYFYKLTCKVSVRSNLVQLFNSIIFSVCLIGLLYYFLSYFLVNLHLRLFIGLAIVIGVNLFYNRSYIRLMHR